MTGPMKKASSMNEDNTNLSKSGFGCYFRQSFINFMNLVIAFWNIWVIHGL